MHIYRFILKRTSMFAVIIWICRWVARKFKEMQPSPFSIRCLRKRKHVPCFSRVRETRVKVFENEKCCGNTSCMWVFPQLFRFLPNFHEHRKREPYMPTGFKVLKFSSLRCLFLIFPFCMLVRWNKLVYRIFVWCFQSI